ncbi:MAG: hypothetical protein AAGB24_16315 [Bacteroidota bacterium]
MKPKVLIVLFFFTLLFVRAQQQITLSNTVKDKVINSNTGVLLARTGKELYGISPESQSIIWKNEALGKVDFGSYYEISFTPLVIFESKPVVNSKLLSNTVNAKGISRTMVNVTNGKVLFDSEEVGFKSVNRTLLIPEHKAVLVDGVKDKELAVAMYRYEDQEMVWQNNLTNSSFFKNLKGTLFEQEKIVLDNNRNVFWLRNNYLLHINATSGKISYEQEKVESIAINSTKDVVYLFSNANQEEKLKRQTEIMAYAVRGMKPLWKESAKVRGVIREVAFDGDKMIAITSTGFNILDKNGNKQWAEMESLPLIKKIVPIEQGFLVVQEKFLSRIGNDGKKVWKDPLKISLSNDEQPVYLFETDTTAIYITPSRANKIAITSGEKFWDDVILNDADFISRNLKLKLPTYRIWYDSIAKQYPVYSENGLYLLNGRAKQTPQPIYTFDFGKSLPNLHMGEYGYFLDNDNQYYLFNGTGDLVYEKKYPSNEESSIFRESLYYLKRGLGTYKAATSFIYNQAIESFSGAVASGNLGFLTNLGSSIYGSYQLYQDPKKIVSNLEELGFSSGLETVFKRIQKGKESEAYILIVSPKEDETKDVIQLHIPTGKEELLKQLGEEEKKFVIDQIEHIIYTFNKKEIRIERL